VNAREVLRIDIDYLARDYDSGVDADRIAVLSLNGRASRGRPRDRRRVDAYVADYLAYRQDATAQAFGTATRLRATPCASSTIQCTTAATRSSGPCRRHRVVDNLTAAGERDHGTTKFTRRRVPVLDAHAADGHEPTSRRFRAAR
jgi:hypothetical protein